MKAIWAARHRNLCESAKRAVKWLLQCHLPVGPINRPLAAALYWTHVTGRVAMACMLRFFWYEPLFRSQCNTVGSRFRMERLPYLVGLGQIDLGDDVQLSGKSSLVFSARHISRPSFSVGSGTFIGHDCAFAIAKRIRIGSHCLIAGGVRIADFDGHSLDAGERRSGASLGDDPFHEVIIGDDVWIGRGAMILKGVRIGDRAVIGASSVVVRDVPPDTVVAGNPARTVKSLRSANAAPPAPHIPRQRSAGNAEFSRLDARHAG